MWPVLLARIKASPKEVPLRQRQVHKKEMPRKTRRSERKFNQNWLNLNKLRKKGKQKYSKAELKVDNNESEIKTDKK